MTEPQGRSSISEIFSFFLHIGLTGFGGPAAHIALMEREAVERRAWVSRERFLDLVGSCNLLPGPSSTQVAMALGYTRRGWTGLVIAGVCFIMPASLVTLGLAWAYVRYAHLPQSQGLLYGTKPVMVAIVAQAVWRLGQIALRGWKPALLGAACFVAGLLGAPPIAILLVAGGLMVVLGQLQSRKHAAAVLAWLPAGSAAPAGGPALVSLALTFVKLGMVIFGSGYVLLVFLKADLVDRLHWITEPQLLDAITAGQVTPGPLFATATFIGYLLRGLAGAAVATMAIFLPSFVMAAVVGALADRIRASRSAAAFLDGVNAAAVALMAEVGFVLGRATLIDLWTWAIALISVVLLVRFRRNATWLILAGAVLGLVLRGGFLLQGLK
jgi:chromate transporter